jgi:DNA polymerase-3 subunit epsilon
VLDTLALARKKFPGSPASLDALSRRFKVDLSKREKHGALLDSEILAVVYLELIGGRQPDLILSSESESPSNKNSTASLTPLSRENVLPTRLTLSEMEAHKVFLKSFGSEALWNKFSS